MPEITLYNMKGSQLGALELPESVFGVELKTSLIHQAVTTEEANMRQGTSDTKTRGEVRGGGRKPWRQKGTGRARQGSTRSPHWYHGGVVFGPHPRSYRKALPIKMRRGAMRSALSAKVADGQMIGLDSVSLDKIATKQVVAALNSLPLSKTKNCKHRGENGDWVRATKEVPHNTLLIIPEHDDTIIKSCRNIPYLTLRTAPNFSVRDVVVAGRIVLAQGAVAKIEEVLG